METIIFEKSSSNVKKLTHLKKNIFIIYCPRTVKIEPATSTKINTEIVVFLPQKAKGYVTSIFRGDEINESCCKKQRLWVEILKKSFEETVEIKKNIPLGFLVVEPEHLKFKYKMAKKKRSRPKEFIDVQNENEGGNLKVFLTTMTLPMQGEIWLTRQQKLFLV